MGKIKFMFQSNNTKIVITYLLVKTISNCDHSPRTPSVAFSKAAASGYVTVCYGSHDPVVDDVPIKNGDFPWLC